MTALLQEYKKFFQKNTDRIKKPLVVEGLELVQAFREAVQFSMYFSGLTGMPFRCTS